MRRGSSKHSAEAAQANCEAKNGEDEPASIRLESPSLPKTTVRQVGVSTKAITNHWIAIGVSAASSRGAQ